MTDRTRLLKLLGMTGSSHDAEALTALRLAQQLMREGGITWEDTIHGNGLLTYQEGWQEGHRAGFEEGHAEGFKEGKNAPRARPASWRATAEEMLAEYGDDLTEWETGFLQSFLDRRWHTPTERQQGVFERIADKVGIELPDAL